MLELTRKAGEQLNLGHICITVLSVEPGRVKMGILAPSSLVSESTEFEFVESVPVAVPGSRPFGLAAGAFVLPEDFDSPLPDDLLQCFEKD